METVTLIGSSETPVDVSEAEALYLLGYEGLSPRVLRQLAVGDMGEGVDIAIAKHANTPPEALDCVAARGQQGVMVAVAGNAHAGAGTLRMLAIRGDIEVRRRVVSNPGTPRELVLEIARGAVGSEFELLTGALAVLGLGIEDLGLKMGLEEFIGRDSLGKLLFEGETVARDLGAKVRELRDKPVGDAIDEVARGAGETVGIVGRRLKNVGEGMFTSFLKR